MPLTFESISQVTVLIFIILYCTALWLYIPGIKPFDITCSNSLAPGEFEWNFTSVIFKQILVIDGWDISCEIALIWMSLDFTDDQSTLVQVMAWCCQATSHYVSQSWPRSLSPFGVIKPQWVKPFDITCLRPIKSWKWCSSFVCILLISFIYLTKVRPLSFIGQTLKIFKRHGIVFSMIDSNTSANIYQYDQLINNTVWWFIFRVKTKILVVNLLLIGCIILARKRGFQGVQLKFLACLKW